MIEIKRQRRVRIGDFEISVAVPEARAQEITGSAMYRKVIRPLARRLYHFLRRRVKTTSTGRQGHAAPEVPTSRPRPEDLDQGARAIIERVAAIDWYHSIDLGRGVVTPGFVDHRSQVNLYGIPESLEGMRCLDVATWDGYWAFELERRGAAEVIALDVARFTDCDVPLPVLRFMDRVGRTAQPMGSGFGLAREVLGSSVRREICSVYDLTPERFGQFDLIFLSDLLLHLRNPQLALDRIFSVCRGTLIVGDVFNPRLEAYGDACITQFLGGLTALIWWCPNSNTLKTMMRVAGFEPVREISRFELNAASQDPIHKIVLHGGVPARHTWEGLAMTDHYSIPPEPEVAVVSSKSNGALRVSGE